MDWLYAPSDPLWETLAGAFLMFLSIILITRLIGLRSFAKFTAFDFAFTVAVGSIISSTLTSSTSIVHGAVAIFGLLIITVTVAYIQRKSPWVDQAISNQPLLLMDGAQILEENLVAARISRSQLMAKLREANVLHFDQVKAVVLETTGDISVLHNSKEESVNVQEEILADIQR